MHIHYSTVTLVIIENSDVMVVSIIAYALVVLSVYNIMHT